MLSGEGCTVDESLCIAEAVGEDERAYLGESIEEAGAVVIVGAARPKGLFVELKLLVLCATIDHCSHAGIAHRQCFYPCVGGRCVPQAQLLGN